MNIIYCFTATGVECSIQCLCHYDQLKKVNIMTCKSEALTALPSVVPEFTDWIMLKNMNRRNLCTIDMGPYESISHFYLESSNISQICDSTLKDLLSSRKLKYLSFANNNISYFSPTWKTLNSHLDKLWLGGNPIKCTCDSIWMMDWLENSTGASGQRLVQDYQNVICASGAEIGTPVYKINRIKMKCYPQKIPVWIVSTASSISGIVLCVVVILLLIHKHRRQIRWLIYKNFDKIIGNPEPNEDVTDRQFDAFISFR